ncbi:hypothetical protein Daus18300_013407 [Diaporthe australafricana]|uniref:Zn(2)-C6 fungal-type domain-containing protein n=1 Tax=Diaporthe australafricana TaxID=127596 RepID=A0ABR3VZ31_9PEZI
MSHPQSLAIPGRFGVPNASGQKFNKACDPCHISKTRCIPDPLSPTNSCKRCSKNGSACAFSPIGPRRRPVRSKNDRIVELERRVRDMQLRLEKQVEKQVESKRANNAGSDADRELLLEAAAAAPGAESFAEGSGSKSQSQSQSHHHHHSQPTKAAPVFSFVPGPGSFAPLPPQQLTSTQAESKSELYKALDAHCPPSQPRPEVVSPPPETDAVARASAPERTYCSPDVVDRGLITLQQADKLIDRFRQFIHGKFLGIGVPDGYTNQSLRRKKPAIWLSMLCAASTGSHEFLSLPPILSREMENLLDSQVQEDLEPDLDILQGLLIFYLYYHDLAQSSRDRLFRCHNLAVAIITKLGQASPIHNNLEGMPVAEDEVTEADLDLSRQLLMWHWTSFLLALKSRENLLIRPFNLISTSLRILETSGSQCDMALVQWTKLVQISLEACLAIFSGHTESAEGLSDEERDSIIRSFERKRRQWLVNCPFDLVNETLMLEYHHSALLLSEVIYPAGRANFQHRSHGLPSLTSPSQSPESTETTTETMPDQDVLAPYRLQYTKKCITAAHSCLALVVSPPVSPDLSSTSSSLGDPEALRYFANVPYSRTFYALRFLLFVAHNIWRTGGYHLINVDSLRAGYYIKGLKRVLSASSDGAKFRPPSLWLYAIETRIEPWWRSFSAMLDRDRPPPPGRSKSTGELEVPSAAGTPATTTAVTNQPHRQTSEPLPHSGHRTASVSPFPQDAQQGERVAVPFDLFAPNQAVDFLIPFNFIQQAPPVVDAGVMPENPNFGPQPFARRSPESIRSGSGSGSGSGGGSAVQKTEPARPPSISQASAPTPLSSRQSTSGGSVAADHQSVGYDLEGAYNQGNTLGELNDFLGTMDLDAFDFDWGDYNALFPGAEAFLSDGVEPAPPPPAPALAPAMDPVLPPWYQPAGDGSSHGPSDGKPEK